LPSAEPTRLPTFSTLTCVDVLLLRATPANRLLPDRLMPLFLVFWLSFSSSLDASQSYDIKHDNYESDS
jgi:hypothetical protein